MDKKPVKHSKSSGRRSYTKKKNKNSKIHQKTKIIKKVKTTPLSTKDLISCLSNEPHFIGVYSADEILSISIKGFPVSLIVNLEPKSNKGSHWVCIWIGKTSIEIFDSLGFDPKSWRFFPLHLFQFLSRFKHSHKFKISPVCQSVLSHYCGLFCIYFICKRPFDTFENCCSSIKSANFNRSFRKACNFILK